MIQKVKKYGIILIIAILFAAFSFSIVDVIKESPEYDDFCKEEIIQDIREGKEEFDTTCHDEYESAKTFHNRIGFIITGILGLIALITGMYASSKNEVVNWIYSGLIIGGIITIFIGTMSYFDDMHRFARPVILLIEMLMIIWVAVRTSKRSKK